MTGDVQRQAAKGAALMFAFKLLDRGLGLISTLILVRLLTPADFGIVAMAMAFIALAEVMAGFGFDIALIHNQRATPQHYHTAWTCNVLLGFTIAALLATGAQPIADFYQKPELFSVVIALALGPAVGGFENIGVVTFRKELRFAREFAFLFGRRFAGFAVVVPAALLLRDYWALVAASLAGRIAGVALSYYVHPFRPRLSLAQAPDLFSFSRWMLGNNLIVFLRERSTDFIIGRLHGATALGLFNVANELSNLPLTELAAPANRALLPAFAKLQDDPAAAQTAFVNAVALLALVAIPAAVGIAAAAPWLVPVVLGDKWSGAAPPVEILAVSGGLIAFQSPTCALLIANGHPQLVFRAHVVYVVVLIATLFALPTHLGARGPAFAVLLAALVSTPVFLTTLRSTVRIPLAPLLRATVRPLLAAAGMYLAIRASFAPVTSSVSLVAGALQLLLVVTAGAAVYAVTLSLLWLAVGRPKGAEALVIHQLGRLLRGRTPR